MASANPPPTNANGAPSAAMQPRAADPHLLWNNDNVRDVAESVGIATLDNDALKTLTQDVEYRIGQVITEALRLMRNARRTTMITNDVAIALRSLGVEPLYGYDSTRPLRYGEATLGPGQPLFYIEDEEVDFEKLINAPLPKVPRDTTFTAHWLAIDGVQPSIPQNPTSAESRSQELVPKGPGANPALAALAGNDNISLRPSVKHIVSKELILYFGKIQAALLDDNPEQEVIQLRQAALASVRDDPGLHQLVPYFINFIASQVTHHLDDTFTLRQMMELTASLIDNKNLFLDPYANPISAPVLTCLMARRVGPDDVGADAIKEQFQLREFAASLVGRIATRYARSNALLRPKLTRTCLKYFLDPTKPPAVLFGAICGISAAGGPEAVRVLVLKNLKSVDAGILQPLQERRDRGDGSGPEFDMLVGGILQAISSMSQMQYSEMAAADTVMTNGGVNGGAASDLELARLSEFVGSVVAERLVALGDRRLVKLVLEARFIEEEAEGPD